MKRSPSKMARAAVSLLLLSTTSGCSFIFVRTPPSDGRISSRVRPGDCTSSKLAPGLDTAFGALQLVRTGMAASANDSVYERPDAPLSRGADIALGVSFMALFAGSAIYGFVNTSRCSRLQNGDDRAPEGVSDPPERWGASSTEARPAAPPSPAAAQPPAVTPEPPAAPNEAPPPPSSLEPSSDAEPPSGPPDETQ